MKTSEQFIDIISKAIEILKIQTDDPELNISMFDSISTYSESGVNAISEIYLTREIDIGCGCCYDEETLLVKLTDLDKDLDTIREEYNIAIIKEEFEWVKEQEEERKHEEETQKLYEQNR